MKRSASLSTSTSSTTRRKSSESSCGTSERLRKLALPNSHLVEAVLKQHSHVFTEDCRDRLRNLLQVIVNVNTNHKKNFDKLNEKLKMGCIKNLQERVNDIQAAEKLKSVQECQCQTESTHSDENIGPRREVTFTYGPCSSSMVCNVSSVTPEDALEDLPSIVILTGEEEEPVTSKEDESSSIKPPQSQSLNEEVSIPQDTEDVKRILDEIYGDKKVFAKDELYATYAQTAEVHHVEVLKDVSSAACGDFDSDLEVLFEGLFNLNKELKREHEPREFGDFQKEIEKREQNKKEQMKQTQRKKPSSEQKSQIPRSVRARHFSATREDEKKKPAAEEHRRRHSMSRQDASGEGGKLSPIPERRSRRRTRGHSKRRVINVPSLAVRAYVALIMDMQRNCALYETFRRDMIKPVEVYKQPYVSAAYDCWMDYMIYVKNTLDYLHPYIMNMVQVYYSHGKDDPEIQQYTTQLPKVLINSMKNIKIWRNALQETIDCLDQIFRVDFLTPASIHSLYTRYYEKVERLPSVSFERLKGEKRKRAYSERRRNL